MNARIKHTYFRDSSAETQTRNDKGGFRFDESAFISCKNFSRKYELLYMELKTKGDNNMNKPVFDTEDIIIDIIVLIGDILKS